jgi:hypothetical protein
LIAYKLLRPGRVGPFSGVVWPSPGEWLDSEQVGSCRAGLHAARAEDLPLWLGLGELWEVELEDVAIEERKVVAHRGCLVRRIERWDADTQKAYVASCAAELERRVANAPELAPFANNIRVNSNPGVSGYIAARVAELDGGPDEYDAERRRQADWLADALQLARAVG